MKIRYAAAALGAIALSLAAIGPAQARQIFIQMSGSSPAGADPNPITDTNAFTLGLAGRNSFTAQDPLLVIVGVYDGMGTPAISFSGCAIPAACPAATVGTYGLTSNTATFLAPVKGKADAYGALGLAGGASENFGNWASGDESIGLAAPSSFDLYAFQLDLSSLDAGNTITLDEGGAANGSYVIGYGCLDGTGSSSGCKKHGDILDTPFTNAGLIATTTTTTSAPEPGSLLLFGAGLATLGFAAIRRRKAA
ncbi:MAG: PEP-CTERM sorting domain-containing protein [Steroidobacteraceae bacterium]